MGTPVLYLAFSNDMEHPLSGLKDESRSINKALAPFENRRSVNIFRDENATTNDIINALQRIGDPANHFELVVFHYGGHADGQGIQLLDAQGNASGLAELLAEFKDSLALVFLNGCSTLAQVDALLRLGIKAIIATESPIEDKKATAFAGIFYQKLAARSSIQSAFDFAAKSIQFKEGIRPEKVPIDISRGLDLSESEENSFPWGLYYDAQATHVLDWSMAYDNESYASSLGADHENILPNEYLLDVAWEMGHLKADIQEQLDDPNAVEDDHFALILKSFPWIISAQIQPLKSQDPSMKELTPERLKQLLSVYLASSQLMYYMAISWLWQLKVTQKIKAITLDVNHFLGVSKSSYSSFDFIHHFHQIIQEIQIQGTDYLASVNAKEADDRPFLIELLDMGQAISEKNAFYEAYLFLETQKEEIIQRGSGRFTSAIGQVCMETEYYLTIFLRQLAFLVNYQMVTCRKVSISKLRTPGIQYQHYISRLHAYREGINVSKDPIIFTEFALDERSVILLKETQKPSHFLNLTPFIIDKNAFFDQNPYGNIKNTATNLFTYLYSDDLNEKNAPQYYYLKCGDNFIDWSNQEDQSNLHKINTNLKMKRRAKPMVRRGPKLSVHEEYPLTVLKNQFEKLKKDWTDHA